jgi:hypothetical protein
MIDFVGVPFLIMILRDHIVHYSDEYLSKIDRPSRAGSAATPAISKKVGAAKNSAKVQ